MILVDTSIWADHFRKREAALNTLLANSLVLGHPLVMGELALGHLLPRSALLEALSALPQAVEAGHADVLALVDREHLMGKGIGLVDAHLLAATRLTDGARLWTRDRKLARCAALLGLAHDTM